MKQRILLVEDEENLLRTIKLNLELEGYDVSAVGTGKDAVKEFKSARFDLVILDVMLPGTDGFTVCQTIRLENDKVPVMFLTAKGNSEDKIQGLKIGGDDYITKPFNLEEFLLRVKILLKRNAPRDSALTSYEFGENKVNFTTFEFTGVKNTGVLTKREAHLLKLLIERKNEVVSREHILETVWGYDIYPSTRTIDNFILAFRKYFEENPREPKYFHSIRGVGYKFSD